MRDDARTQMIGMAHAHQWNDHLPHYAWRGEYDRGFVSTVTITDVAAFVRDPDALWRHEPVSFVELGDRTMQDIAKMTALPQAARIKSIRVYTRDGNDLSDDTIFALLNTKYCPDRLVLDDVRASETGMHLLRQRFGDGLELDVTGWPRD